MNNSTHNATVSIDLAVALSERILQAIEQQDIESVNTLYGDRQRVIDQLYPSASIAPAATRHLLQLNEKIVDQLNRLKLQTQRRQLDIRQGAKATRAYQDLAAAKPKG